MKKFGECLFAISKTQRRTSIPNQVIDLSDQASNGEIVIDDETDSNFDE